MLNFSLYKQYSVLVLTEIVFFLVVDMVLYFGVEVRIMLIASWCFCCCWTFLSLKRELLNFYHPVSEEAGNAQEAGRPAARAADPDLLKQCSIPYSIMLNKHLGDVGQGRGKKAIAPWGLTGHWLASSEQLHCVSLYLILYMIVVVAFPSFFY